MNRKHWLVLVAAGALAALAGTAWATGAVTSIVAPDGTINGCYRANGQDDDEGQKGQLRVVAAGKQCKKNELAIQWSQKGPKGDTGAQGAAGQAGLKGDTGLPGATGAKGDTGTAGATGPAGLQGGKGDPGASGAAGANGDTGIAGATGLAGTAGATGLSGQQGAQGVQGIKGDTGGTGAGVTWFGNYVSGILSPVYPVGSLVRYGGSIWIALQQVTGRCSPFTGCPPRPGEDESIWQLFAQDGTVGAEGSQGSPGATGVAGPQGPGGPPGAQGSLGPQGSPGTKGDTGPAGPTGPAGNGVTGGVHSYGFVTDNSPGGSPTMVFEKNATVTFASGNGFVGYWVAYPSPGPGGAACIPVVTPVGLTPRTATVVGFSGDQFSVQLLDTAGVPTTGSFTFSVACS